MRTIHRQTSIHGYPQPSQPCALLNTISYRLDEMQHAHVIFWPRCLESFQKKPQMFVVAASSLRTWRVFTSSDPRTRSPSRSPIGPKRLRVSLTSFQQSSTTPENKKCKCHRWGVVGQVTPVSHFVSFCLLEKKPRIHRFYFALALLPGMEGEDESMCICLSLTFSWWAKMSTDFLTAGSKKTFQASRTCSWNWRRSTGSCRASTCRWCFATTICCWRTSYSMKTKVSHFSPLSPNYITFVLDWGSGDMSVGSNI